jgi:hypothetical protein
MRGRVAWAEHPAGRVPAAVMIATDMAAGVSPDAAFGTFRPVSPAAVQPLEASHARLPSIFRCGQER